MYRLKNQVDLLSDKYCAGWGSANGRQKSVDGQFLRFTVVSHFMGGSGAIGKLLRLKEQEFIGLVQAIQKGIGSGFGGPFQKGPVAAPEFKLHPERGIILFNPRALQVEFIREFFLVASRKKQRKQQKQYSEGHFHSDGITVCKINNSLHENYQPERGRWNPLIKPAQFVFIR